MDEEAEIGVGEVGGEHGGRVRGELVVGRPVVDGSKDGFSSSACCVLHAWRGPNDGEGRRGAHRRS
jgi:hypothetical protein